MTCPRGRRSTTNWRTWRIGGRWEQILTRLREVDRTARGRDPTLGAGVCDSQSVRAGDRGGLHGYDGGKKVNGVKRHLLVDTLGTVLTACVSPAGVDDRDGAKVLLSQACDTVARLRHVWADQGYRGPKFRGWAAEAVGVSVQVVAQV